MFYVLQNESTAARRRVPILLTDSATGTTAQAGVSTASIYPYVNINGGAFIGGTGAVGEAGFGQYYYEFEANEVATLGLAGIHITAAGCRDYDAITQIAAFNLYSAGSGGGISAYDVWTYVNPNTGNATELDLTNASQYAQSADNNANLANTQTVNIAGQVWGEDFAASGNAPYAAGTAGTILYNLSQGGGGISAYDVWNFDPTGMSSPQAGAILNDTFANTNTISSDVLGVPNLVWSQDITGYVTPGEAGYELGQAAAGSGLTAGDVWNFTVLGFGTTDSAAQYLTGAYTDSANTYNQLVNFTPSDVWDFVITGFGQTGSAAQYVTDTNFTAGNIETYLTTQTPIDIWSFNGVGGRTITGGIADTVTTLTDRSGFAITGGTITTVSDKTGYSLSASQTFDFTGNITGNVSGSVGSVTNPVSVATTSMTGIAGSVWNSLTSAYTANGTYGLNVLRADQANKVGDVTLYSSGGVNGVDADMHRIANDTTAATNLKNALIGVGATWTGNIAGTVNDVVNPVDVDTASMTGIAGTVWNYVTRTLTSGGGSGISAYDVWNFVLSDTNTAEVDLVSAASGGAGISAGDVWSYGSRTITGGLADTVTTLTDRSGFAITGGTITTVSDKTGYSLSTAGVNAVQAGLSTLTQAQVGTEVDSSLADVGLTSTVTGRIDVAVSSRLASASYTAPPSAASIASSVWSEPAKTITGGTVDSVTNPVSVSTSSMTGIAGTVWSYGSRTLTSAAGATAGDVWTYPTRSLTSGAGITVNAATNIINGPYFVKSNVHGQDNTLDVIRGMVQDIQLTVTDAFGNPFDTTALGLAVNFYDQAGTLTTSYGTTELYGPAGLIQFTLDTAVTANEGRYNLILSAAGSGNTIKFGPLQTLVRPF